MGYVERAANGTLFLDEIGDVSPMTQTALLRLLEGGEVHRIGSVEERHFSVRVLAATHRDLKELMAQGRFRADLYYRLHVLPVHVPALRDRREDIPLLITRFLEQVGRPELVFSKNAIEALQTFEFPGNVRELRNLVERVAGTLEPSVVEPADLPGREEPEMSGPAGIGVIGEPFRQAVASFERHYLEALLKETHGNISESARIAGLSRPGLHARLAHLRIDPSHDRDS
jgi:DNA-binding NtrC family response regulator